jgi:hypothetical protein
MTGQNNISLEYISGLEYYFLARLTGAEIETILSQNPHTIFTTLKQYREYTEPSSTGWEDYCLSIFHLLGISTNALGAGKFRLEGRSGKSAGLTILADLDDGEIINLKNQAGWSILLDGWRMLISHSAVFDGRNKVIVVELEQILETDSSVDFRALMVLLIKVMNQNPDAGKGQSNKTLDGYFSYFITPYASEFANIRTLTNYKQFSVRTNFMAPYKVLLLLTIMDRIKEGRYEDGIVRIDQDLEDRFRAYWEGGFQTKADERAVVYPFFYFRSSSFWRLVPTPGNEVVLSETSDVTIMSKLKQLVDYAQLDLNLVETLRNPTYFEELLNVLLMTYFNEQTAAAIRNFRANNA